MTQANFILRIVLGLDLKLVKSLYRSVTIKGERPGLGILIFGKSYLWVDKTAKIDCLNGGRLYFNKPVHSPEPFHGKLEMYPNSKFTLTGNFVFHSGAHIIVTENALLRLGGDI